MTINIIPSSLYPFDSGGWLKGKSRPLVHQLIHWQFHTETVCLYSQFGVWRI
jgi:hypothetical protein